MAHDNIEIEIKVKIENLSELVKFLDANGSFKGEKQQVDEYFSPEHEDFMAVRPVNEWLRLRQSEGRYSMDYKLWHRGANNVSEYCDEIETTVGNGDQARKILLALHFQPIGVVDKVRKAWVCQNYEIAIDSVKGLGDFVEIEYVGQDGNMDFHAIMAGMITFLKGLNCGKMEQISTGYIMLLLFPGETEYVLL